MPVNLANFGNETNSALGKRNANCHSYEPGFTDTQIRVFGKLYVTIDGGFIPPPDGGAILTNFSSLNYRVINLKRNPVFGQP